MAAGLMEQVGGEDVSLVCYPDPFVLELNSLQNQLKEKERELGKARSEIRGLRATEVMKDKAVEELGNEVQILEEKLRANENQLDQKNLNIKKLKDESREALAAQYAAEATLRRVYADQKDDNCIPIESVIAPLEAELKMRKNEVAAVQEDKKALERLMKSKEAALLEAEKILKSALERALVVEEIQNQNFELRRQIEICQEENKILDKTNRQKVVEVERLSQTIKELEEAILAAGAAANTIRDYKRQISELNEEKRTLERELARVKVSTSRIASVMANEWKDEKDKVMPVKQWLEERRVFQAEMQKLKDKLAISERTVKAETQVKEKLKLRLKTLEEALKQGSTLSMTNNGSPKDESSNAFFGILSTNKTRNRSTSQPRASTIPKSPRQMMAEKTNSCVNNSRNKNMYSGESLLKRSFWASRSKVIDRSEKENTQMNKNEEVGHEKFNSDETADKEKEGLQIDSDDIVSGFLYDKLQKEVIRLRKFCKLKDNTLTTKDHEIKILMKKVDTLTRAIEVESKKMKKRVAAMRDNDTTMVKADDKTKTASSLKRSAMIPL